MKEKGTIVLKPSLVGVVVAVVFLVTGYRLGSMDDVGVESGPPPEKVSSERSIILTRDGSQNSVRDRAGQGNVELEQQASKIALLRAENDRLRLQLFELEQERYSEDDEVASSNAPELEAFSATGELSADERVMAKTLAQFGLALKPQDIPLIPTIENGGFNDDDLLDTGIEPESVQEFVSQIADLEFERAALVARAETENWDNATRIASWNEVKARSKQVRESIGESKYDAYLYTAGRPNRVALASLPEASAAAVAGLMPGDVVLTYDGSRVYEVGDLRANSLGGETVPVTVKRGDEIIALHVPRGPLGVDFSTESANPDGSDLTPNF